MTYQHEHKAPKDEPSRSSDVKEDKAESLEIVFCFDILLHHVSCPVISLHMKKRAKDSEVCFFWRQQRVTDCVILACAFPLY